MLHPFCLLSASGCFQEEKISQIVKGRILFFFSKTLQLDISLKHLVFILVPGLESELSSATDSLCRPHRRRCHVEAFAFVLRSRECSKAMNRAVSYVALYPVYPVHPFHSCFFPALALSPCSPALSYASLLSFSIIPGPRCGVRAAALL